VFVVDTQGCGICSGYSRVGVCVCSGYSRVGVCSQYSRMGCLCWILKGGVFVVDIQVWDVCVCSGSIHKGGVFVFVVDTQGRGVVPDVSVMPPSPQLSSLYETVTTSKPSREPTLNIMLEEEAAEVGSGKLSQCMSLI